MTTRVLGWMIWLMTFAICGAIVYHHWSDAQREKAERFAKVLIDRAERSLKENGTPPSGIRALLQPGERLPALLESRDEPFVLHLCASPSKCCWTCGGRFYQPGIGWHEEPASAK